MKKTLILLIVITIMLAGPITGSNSYNNSEESGPIHSCHEGIYSISAAGSSGSNLDTIVFMSRESNSQQVDILNTYAKTNIHEGVIDLSPYHIPGWHLYQVEMNVSSLVAAPEKQVIGIVGNSTDFQIVDLSGTWHSQLAQGFYNEPFNGTLLNYSICYVTDSYVPSQRGNASVHINSNYATSSSITAHVNITPSESVTSWLTVTGENAPLNSGTTYYAIINGSTLIKGGIPAKYPTIYWISESYNPDSDGPFPSYEKLNTVWDSKYVEALFNYTYLPWNRVDDIPLEFSTPEEVSIAANGTSMTGLSWAFSTGFANLTTIQLDSNQSLYLDYNLILWYKQISTSTTLWSVEASSSPISWNASSNIAYPVVSGITGQFMNITNVPLDWTTTGLYLDTSPDGSESKIGSVVYCSGLSDGTWTLTSTAPNYVTGLDLSDSSDSSPIEGYVSNLVDMDIDATIEDGASTPMTGGTTNLTVLQMGTAIYAPAEIPAFDGHSAFLWDISATTTGNGTHSVEVYWSNGLEAGYLREEVFVFYATSLIADSTNVQAYTDDSFPIGVDFTRVFPVGGIDASLATVMYSFGSTVNASLDDQGSGRWNASVSTAGMFSGTYTLYIYAEGYALENRNLTILVDLTYGTLPLNWSWSPGSSITYLQNTNLTVSYKELGGPNILDASVNVTFEAQTYSLAWDDNRKVYWIGLHGSDFTEIPGTISLNISAWKAGYASQYNDTLTISIAVETDVQFSVTWNPANRTIAFIEDITISVTYDYNSGPISGASVRIEFIGYQTVYMIYNTTTEQWEVRLSGSEYLGNTSLTIWANRTGYETKSNFATLYVLEDIPSLTSSWAASSHTTDYATDAPLTITVEDSTGSPIVDANLTITVNGVDTTYLPGDYTNDISPPQTAGVYTVNVTMVRYGYTTTTIFLTLTVRATTEIAVNTLSHEYEQWNLNVTVTYSDSVHSTPITGAIVTMTLDGVDYTLVYSAGSYVIEIVLDVAPGVYTLSVSATAPLANSASDSVQLTVDSKRGVHLELVSEGNPSIEGQLVSLSATLRFNDTSEAVVGATVHFVVTITFENGTVQVLDGPTQSDITNSYGVATWSFYVPGGTIESIEAEALFDGSRLLWSASRTITVGAGTNPILALFLFFIMSPVGRILIGSFILLGIVVAAYNRVVKPKKREAKLSLENQLQMFVDLESLRHFMAVYLDRGTCVFYHPFTEERIQPDLISGFIAAITSVYGEIKGDGVRGTLEEIQYHGLRLNSYSGEKIIGILILEGEMTPLLKDRLQFFVELFENQYERDLESWSGLIDCFDSEWIVSTLNAAFNYSWLLPHRFGPTQKVSKTDARILDYIAAVRDNKAEFYLRKLLSPLSEMLQLSEAQVLDRLLALQDKGAIVPVGVQTVLQRQGMGLSDGHEGEEATPPTPPPEEEISWEIEQEAKPVPAKEQKKEPTPAAEIPVKAPEPEPKEETDSMEAFVRDVESLLRKEKKKGEGDKKDKEE